MTTFKVGDRVEFVQPYPVYDITVGTKATVTAFANGYDPLVTLDVEGQPHAVVAYAHRIAKIAPEPMPKFPVGSTVVLTEPRGFSYPAGTVGVVTGHRLSFARRDEFIATVETVDGDAFSSYEFRLAAYEFAEGDHVVVSSPIYRTALATYEHDAATVKVGDAGVVEYSADPQGDVRVRFASGDWNYVASDGLTLIAEPKPEPAAIKVGDKFRVTDTAGGHGFAVGTVVTVVNEGGEPDGVDQRCPLVTTGGDLDDPEWEAGVTAYVNPDDQYGPQNVEPYVPAIIDPAKVSALLAQIDDLRAAVAALVEG